MSGNATDGAIFEKHQKPYGFSPSAHQKVKKPYGFCMSGNAISSPIFEKHQKTYRKSLFQGVRINLS